MKKISFLFLALSLLTPAAWSSTNKDLQEVMGEVTRLQKQLVTDKAPSSELKDQEETQLFGSLTLAYDFLKSADVEYRYLFLYSAVSAFHKARLQHNPEIFRSWIKEANSKVYSEGKDAEFYNSWKIYSQSIEDNIHDSIFQHSKDAKPISVEAVNNIMTRLRNIANETMRESKPSVKTVYVNVPVENAKSLDWILLGSIAGCFVLLVALMKSYNNVNKVQKKLDAPVSLPTIPLQALKSPLPPRPSMGLDLESEFKATIERNRHLVELATVDFQAPQMSPFKTTLTAKSAELNDALQSVLKGVLAIANNSKERPTHLDWSCTERQGQLDLEVNLHGIQCDTQTLFTQALMDGHNSAPAHFGRAEKYLMENKAQVSIRNAMNKVSVSLTMNNKNQAQAYN